jgi:hypothetical protein
MAGDSLSGNLIDAAFGQLGDALVAQEVTGDPRERGSPAQVIPSFLYPVV